MAPCRLPFPLLPLSRPRSRLASTQISSLVHLYDLFLKAACGGYNDDVAARAIPFIC